jgi:molybdenum ABC transporter molybdate-binding protein
MPVRLNPAWAAVAGSLGLLGLLVGLLLWGTSGPGTLLVHCAASIRLPLEAIAADYERDTGQRIEVQPGGSETLLAGIERSGRGDLFLPADESYIQAAQAKGLLADVFPLARERAVVLVRAGYPGRIAAWSDLVADGVRLAQANPDAAAVGKLCRDHLGPSGKWAELERRRPVSTGTVVEVANAVKLGSVDAGIVWDVVAAQYPGLTVVHLPELEPVVAKVEIAVLKSGPRPADALRFARYVASPDHGLPYFRKFGFEVIGGGSGSDPAAH